MLLKWHLYRSAAVRICCLVIFLFIKTFHLFIRIAVDILNKLYDITKDIGMVKEMVMLDNPARITKSESPDLSSQHIFYI